MGNNFFLRILSLKIDNKRPFGELVASRNSSDQSNRDGARGIIMAPGIFPPLKESARRRQRASVSADRHGHPAHSGVGPPSPSVSTHRAPEWQYPGGQLANLTGGWAWESSQLWPIRFFNLLANF